MHTMLTDGVDWVGAIDWNIRDFHGYETGRGSTYNAYLVRGERTALIDTVKRTFSDVLLANIEERVGLDAIDYVVANHGEPDHSSALPGVMEATGATLVTNAKCVDTLGATTTPRAGRWRSSPAATRSTSAAAGHSPSCRRRWCTGPTRWSATARRSAFCSPTTPSASTWPHRGASTTSWSLPR